MRDMDAQAERGMSEPPEVVFSTATDPGRAAAWLPAALREADAPEVDADALRARWHDSGGTCSAALEVRPVPAGGATVRLALAAADGTSDAGEKPSGVASDALERLASEVAENLTAG
jgi:hypothetical protein